jgi:hypothetical protein
MPLSRVQVLNRLLERRHTWCSRCDAVHVTRGEKRAAHNESDLRTAMIGYQAGNRAEMERFQARVWPDLLDYFSARTNSDREARRLVEVTLMQVHRARRTYDPNRPVRPWLYAIAQWVQATPGAPRQSGRANAKAMMSTPGDALLEA